MKVLFIGGTGTISSACAAEAVERGIELTLLNRGQSHRPAAEDARVLTADVRDRASVEAALAGRSFDAVVDWIAFTPEHVNADIETFRGRTGQFVFISSASCYQTPPATLPVTEDTPLENPFWTYSQEKIACEDALQHAYDDGFPVTIVRPSHTYDRATFPLHGRYTPVDRMRRGKKVIVHGDGTSVWTLTHARDFARAFVPLLGEPRALGEAFHITSDEWLTWNAIYRMVAAAAGATADIVHIPSDVIARHDPEWGAGLLGDKAHSMLFDNRKIRTIAAGWQAAIPFAEGVREILAWHDADPARQRVDPALDARMDALIERWQA